MRDANATVMATDCPLAAIQIEQATGIRPLNPAEIIALAYEPEGFATAVAPHVAEVGATTEAAGNAGGEPKS
jgi:glycerol-3-phosphate dehydrogenase subunit C